MCGFKSLVGGFVHCVTIFSYEADIQQTTALVISVLAANKCLTVNRSQLPYISCVGTFHGHCMKVAGASSKSVAPSFCFTA
jgi:hypothetical protein